MTDTITRWGTGLLSTEHTEYLNNGTMVAIETVNIDSFIINDAISTSKISTDSIDSTSGLPGQVLTITEYGTVEWVTPSVLPDKELREQYPSLQISWDRVMEALQEYEMVKKLVQDYD